MDKISVLVHYIYIGTLYMLEIQNTTLQGFYIPFQTPEGLKEIYIRPRSSIKVPKSYSSVVLNNLLTRRMLRVVNIED